MVSEGTVGEERVSEATASEASAASAASAASDAPAASEASTGADGGAGLTDEVRRAREAELRGLIELMRPAVQADGGDLELVSFDVVSGEVEVQLRGACSSCAISSATLQGGVERILRGRLDWVTEVTGGVDEDEDPFASAALGRGGYIPRT